MNEAQCLYIRQLLRNMQLVLVDLHYSCECLKCKRDPFIKQMINNISNTLRSFLTTTNQNYKKNLIEEFFQNHFQDFKTLKLTIGCIIEKDVRKIYDDFWNLVEKTAQNQGVIIIDKNSITEKLEPLKALKKPFANLEEEPIDVKGFISSFTNICALGSEKDINELYERGYHFRNYFFFLKYLNQMTEYNNMLKKGELKSSNENTSHILRVKQSKNEIRKSDEILHCSLKISSSLMKTESETKPLKNICNTEQASDNIISQKIDSKHSIKTKKSKNKGITIASDSAKDKLSETTHKLHKIDSDKKKSQYRKRVTVKLYKQKSLALQKENQILRENKNIIMLQKQEMQKYYEQQIGALIQELKYLQSENSRLKSLVNKEPIEMWNENQEQNEKL